MEVYGAAIRESVSLLRGAGEASPFSVKSRVRARQRAAVAMKLWSDDGPRLYYASPPRCGGVRDAKRKEKKKRAALVTELSKDLAALYSMELGMDGGEGIAGEVRGNMIKDSAELLLAQLNHQKSKEKEMKKRKKEEKEAMKAALKMRNCAEISSSSSSSESSDSDCEEVAVMDKPRKKNLQEEDKPNILDVPECNQAQSSPEVEVDGNDGLNLTKLKLESELSSNCMNSIAVAIPECNQAQSSPEVEEDDNDKLNLTKLKLESELSSNCMNSIAVAMPLDKIEVCLGGKCKKSGAIDLLKELEKKIGFEGAVTGCKCMGKCKEGPNVRIVNHCSLQDEFGEVSKKVLCIGVGLEDVSAIVANFLGEKNIDMSFLGA